MIIEYSSELYPENLRTMGNPPSRIYAKGNIEILKNYGISVIGSRTNTRYGEEMCKTFTRKLVEYNLNIISGLAIGIDTIAHKTCIENSGKTIAVLPSGLNNIYPKTNLKLADKIIENGGLLISEYEDQIKADSKKFLERNRIIAGLGIGTLVIEAGFRSGTSVTAKQTEKQGKPVFCIPSSLENIKGKTTNRLIQEGANLVISVEDIIKHYSNIQFTKRKTIKNSVNIEISRELTDVYKVINNIPKDLNQISRETKISVHEISYKIMMLEIEGLVMELPGQRFIRNEED